MLDDTKKNRDQTMPENQPEPRQTNPEDRDEAYYQDISGRVGPTKTEDKDKSTVTGLSEEEDQDNM
jgi:hypothetical protein